MYIYENPNPYNKITDDCLVRTLAIIMDKSWEESYDDLCYYGRLIYDMPNQDATLSLYLRQKGYERYIIPNTCPTCYSVIDFCRDNPTGKYILLTSNHAIPVINGNYYDTSDSGENIPLYYWTKERKTK